VARTTAGYPYYLNRHNKLFIEKPSFFDFLFRLLDFCKLKEFFSNVFKIFDERRYLLDESLDIVDELLPVPY
jgi:hypothetical protein